MTTPLLEVGLCRRGRTPSNQARVEETNYPWISIIYLSLRLVELLDRAEFSSHSREKTKKKKNREAREKEKKHMG